MVVNLVADAQGQLPLPWLEETLPQAASRARGHATLVHGHAGDGSLHLALALAGAWLCESRVADSPLRACGRCASCHLLRAKMHPDLLLVMPQQARQEHAWPLSGDKAEDSDAGEDGKARKKASRQIRIDEVRLALDWIVTTSARGRAKVLVLHPATAMNPHSANALLKTLEEPQGLARIVLTAAQPAHLLPTVRSRCQAVHLPTPAASAAQAWLAQQGAPNAAGLLAAADGLPLLALQWHAAGLTPEIWNSLPRRLAQGREGKGDGQGEALSGPLPWAIHALQCLAHDLACVAAGAAPRYFPRDALPKAVSPEGPGWQQLAAWQAELLALARHSEHPWSEGLLLESLSDRARQVMRSCSGRASKRPARGPLHSAHE